MTRMFRLSVVVAFGCAWSAMAEEQETALDRYVKQKDDVYAWKIVSTTVNDGVRTDVIELTSQQWRSEKDVDRSVWKHWLTVVRPPEVKFDTAFLYITGGENDDPPPSEAPEMVKMLALESGSVAAELRMVPNQPIRFTDSADEAREEDNLVAYTRVKHMQTNDDTWLVRLAMVKSGVRAMDCIEELTRQPDYGGKPVKRFVVAGASKRGWTTWLVGAVDDRVRAIVPIVIDALNSEAITRHHYEAYGFFSPALNDYVRHGLFPGKVGTPEYRKILGIEDPYNYRHRERLKMPKYVVNAAGDEFFLPDNWQFYYPELPEEKHLRYVPNAKHNLAGSNAREGILAFYQSILADRPRPKYSWKELPDGSLRIEVDDKPREVILWQATNPEARDFRLDVIGNTWTPSTLEPTDDGVYIANVQPPPKGFTAFLVELVYEGVGQAPQRYSTGTSVVPDVLPYDFKDAMKSVKP